MTTPHNPRDEAGRLAMGAHPLSAAAPGVMAGSSVVVVDDTAANVVLLERLLGRVGVTRVHGFTDPAEALAHCRRSRPDLVVLDLHMPGLDGFAVMEALRALPPTSKFLPVLVVTADATTEVKQQALAAGAKDFLTKPFDHTEVLLRVRNLLETRALYGRLERHNARLQATVDDQAAKARAQAAEHKRRLDRIDGVLAGEGLTAVFQPVSDVRTGEVVGAEALARFASEPCRPPDEWFAEAAEVGRGVDLELAAVATALAQIDRLPAGSFMAVNVSAITIGSRALRELLTAHPGERVVLELTEHVRVDDYGALVDALDGLRGFGLRVAVDDTGAGYAGLQHILRLHPEILKLDATLTRGIDTDPARRSLATALVTFAQEIRATIIAEGVETRDELGVLQRIGIPWAQGYYVAHPGALPVPTRPLDGDGTAGPARSPAW